MKTFKQFQKEDEGGPPANAAGLGNIAGLGVGKAGKPANWGEPGVNLKKRRQDESEDPVLTKAMKKGEPVVDGSTRELNVVHPEPDYSSKTDNELDVWVRTHGRPTQADWEKAAQPETRVEGQSDFDYSNDIVEALVREGLLESAEPTETFAGAAVFEVDMDRLHKSRFGKNRYHRYSRYVGEDDIGQAIRAHGRSRKSGDIILKDSKTAVMTYLRRKAPIG